MDRTGTAYETNYETRQEVIEATPVVNKGFVKSISGILKVTEIILSCIVLICVTSVTGWSNISSGGWVNFVAAITLITATIFFIFYLFFLIRKLPGPWVIIEFATLIISAFFWFIAMCVSASYYAYGGGAIAAAVFSAAAMAVYIAELITRFRCERSGNALKITITGITTTRTAVPTTTPMPGQPSNAQMGGYPTAYAPGERADPGYGMP